VLVMREGRGDDGDDTGGDPTNLDPTDLDPTDEVVAPIQAPREPGEGGAITLGEAARAYYLYLRREGVFFGTGERAVRHSIDLLERPEVRAGWVSSRLGELLAELPEDRQLRGAILNVNGELQQLLEPILADAADGEGEALSEIDRDAWRDAVARVEAATLAGGFEPSGDAVLELELLAALEDRAGLIEVLEETLAATAEDVELDRELRETDRGVAVTLRLRDVPGLVRRELEERRVLRPDQAD
jgi:hypothetical protein